MTPPALPPPPDQAQRDLIVRELDLTLLVEAAAGTGKTSSMVDRLVALLAEGKCSIATLAAVTFTRKAAAELRARFQVALDERALKARGEPKRRLAAAAARIEQCFIGTIHSFCARLLSERPVEAQVDVGFEELDDDADARLRRQAWDEHVAALYGTEDPLLNRLDELGLEIGQLKPTFEAIALYPDVTQWPAPPPPTPDFNAVGQALRDYASRMERLLPDFPRDPGTDKLMLRYGRISRMVRHADLSRAADLIHVLEACDTEHGATQKYWHDKKIAKAEAKSWDDFRNDTVKPFLAAARAYRYPVVLDAVRPAIARHNDLRAAAGALNFQDLLLAAAHLLRDKPHIRRYFRQRFSHLLVDEFQDTDPIQAEVMLLLTAQDPDQSDWRRCRPVSGSLFVVGDPKQSIYRFRRADIVTYNEVKRLIQEAGGRVVQLSANFRCVEPLVGWVNGAFSEKFPDAATPQSPAYVPLQFARLRGSDGLLTGIQRLDVPPELTNQADIAEYEAGLIARTIRDALDRGLSVPRTPKELDAGIPPSVTPGDFLIVTRVKKRLSVYARKLQELGIPHQVTGGTALNEVRELELLRRCLAAVVRSEDSIALVATLRSPLFGFSDPGLYAFKKAGGEFRYTAPVPTGLDESIRQLFDDAFTRLRAYARWLATLPAPTAVEKLVSDLGLLVLAASGPGGDVQAGTLAKAIELLRSADRTAWTAADLIAVLDQLLAGDPAHDGMPARPGHPAVVRIMNLHKAKGLEAPIVFLADPSGESDHPVSLHVDRSGTEPRGFLAVYGDKDWRGRSPLLAHPEGWDDLASAEKAFGDAEILRLLYVAATRAGSQLIVSQRARSSGKNPWAFFAPHLEDIPPLPDPGPQTAPAAGAILLRPEDIQDGLTQLSTRWAEAASLTYTVAAAKRLSLAEDSLRPTLGEHGTEWGDLVHRLLQVAMKDPAADLAALARSAVEGDDCLDPDAAVETVRSVMASALWRRASAGKPVLVETPFAASLDPNDPMLGSAPATVPTLLRGVIDLAFLEPDGWVIVDYKTDRATSAGRIEALVEHYLPQVRLYAAAWTRCTEEPVKEIGLYFTSVGRYASVGVRE